MSQHGNYNGALKEKKKTAIKYIKWLLNLLFFLGIIYLTCKFYFYNL